MIAPDMATMLSFIFTDANIPSDILQSLLSRNVTNTFNAITGDSDASTSDTLLLFATGAAQSPKLALKMTHSHMCKRRQTKTAKRSAFKK